MTTKRPYWHDLPAVKVPKVTDLCRQCGHVRDLHGAPPYRGACRARHCSCLAAPSWVVAGLPEGSRR